MTKEVTIVNHEAFGVFLCTFFAGWSLECPIEDVRKIADTNFRRIYKSLSTWEKEEVRKQMNDYKTDPKGEADKMIELMELFKDSK